MHALVVTPSLTGTGEAMTAGYVARDLLGCGHTVQFAASPTTARLLTGLFPGAVTVFADEADDNRSIWRDLISARPPDVIVFADYPLLFMTSGTMPLACPDWIAELRETGARLVTLDHLGFAQGPGAVYFGPPHLALHVESFDPAPDDMQILLPCPLFDGPVPGWRGTPVRYWDQPPGIPDAAREDTRRQLLAGDERFLIVHSTPGWAIQMAEEWGLPHYDVLPRILAHYLSALPSPAVLVSINDGALLPASDAAHLRVVNMPQVPAVVFERLLLSADLVVSDNRVSASVAKAVCAGVPTVALTNSLRLRQAAAADDPQIAAVVGDMERRRPGSVFPFDVFPIWSRQDLDQLGLFRQPLYDAALVRAELFGGSATADLLAGLLVDPTTRRRLRESQDAYVSSISRVARAADVLTPA
jgi:hypothetical protein